VPGAEHNANHAARIEGELISLARERDLHDRPEGRADRPVSRRTG